MLQIQKSSSNRYILVILSPQSPLQNIRNVCVAVLWATTVLKYNPKSRSEPPISVRATMVFGVPKNHIRSPNTAILDSEPNFGSRRSGIVALPPSAPLQSSITPKNPVQNLQFRTCNNGIVGRPENHTHEKKRTITAILCPILSPAYLECWCCQPLGLCSPKSPPKIPIRTLNFRF